MSSATLLDPHVGAPRAATNAAGGIETVDSAGLTLAMILRASYSTDGLRFFTPDEYSQQLAYMRRAKGYVIPPHVHNPVRRDVLWTKEVLFIRSGRVRVDFYGDDCLYLESRIISTGDVVLLAFGGHGFEMLEESEIIEVKQGPYAGEADKTRFAPIGAHEIRIR